MNLDLDKLWKTPWLISSLGIEIDKFGLSFNYNLRLALYFLLQANILSMNFKSIGTGVALVGYTVFSISCSLAGLNPGSL